MDITKLVKPFTRRGCQYFCPYSVPLGYSANSDDCFQVSIRPLRLKEYSQVLAHLLIKKAFKSFRKCPLCDLRWSNRYRSTQEKVWTMLQQECLPTLTKQTKKRSGVQHTSASNSDKSIHTSSAQLSWRKRDSHVCVWERERDTSGFMAVWQSQKMQGIWKRYLQLVTEELCVA